MLTAVNQQVPLGLRHKDIDPTWLPITAFVEKPVDFDELKSRIGAMLTNTRGERNQP